MNSMNTPRKFGSSAAFAPVGTPNHLDRIENLQMDFSAVKDISDSFGGESNMAGLKTPTANVKSQNSTPNTHELKTAQNDIFRLRDQIMAIKADLNSENDSPLKNRENVDSIVNKLSGMLETYENVATQYENQLKQFLVARKASKLDSNNSRFEEELSLLSQEKSNLLNELERVRNDLYQEIQQNDQIKNRFIELEDEFKRMKTKMMQQEEELQNSRYDNTRVRTENEIKLAFEEEHRKRAMEHETELKSLKKLHEEELHQKKILIGDLQNEVGFLKQTEKVLEEELNNRRLRVLYSEESSSDNNNNNFDSQKEELRRENLRLTEEISNSKRQCEDFKRLWEDAQTAKMRSEEYYRGEMERMRAEPAENEKFDELRRDFKEITGRLKQARADNEELLWALETSRKESERLNSLIQEQAQKLSEREKKLHSFSERIQELEGREINEKSREVEDLQVEIRKLSIELGEEKSKAIGPLEQLSALKRKICLIEREKELLEEQVRTCRLSAYSQGEFQSFSTFIQGLKRHIEAEILSIEPLKLTLQDVVRAKEMVEILIKVTEDVRVKVVNHLSQVEDVIRSRGINFGMSLGSTINETDKNINTTTTTTNALINNNNTMIGNSGVETLKTERVRAYESSSLNDLRRKIDFRNETPQTQYQSRPVEQRTLREPLRVTSIPSASNLRPNDYNSYGSSSNFLNSNSRSRSNEYNFEYDANNNNNINNNNNNNINRNTNNLENRMDNFRTMVSDLRSRAPLVVQSNYNTSRPSFTPTTSSITGYPSSSNVLRAQELSRCNLCQEYGHDALSCPDYLSGTESFSEDNFLKDMRNSKYSSRLSERTRV